jgi:hypothetical protein
VQQVWDCLNEDDALQGEGHLASPIHTHISRAFSVANLDFLENKSLHELVGLGSESASKIQ